MEMCPCKRKLAKMNDNQKLKVSKPNILVWLFKSDLYERPSKTVFFPL